MAKVPHSYISFVRKLMVLLLCTQVVDYLIRTRTGGQLTYSHDDSSGQNPLPSLSFSPQVGTTSDSEPTLAPLSRITGRTSNAISQNKRGMASLILINGLQTCFLNCDLYD